MGKSPTQMISLSWSALGDSFPSRGGKRSQKLCECPFGNRNPGCPSSPPPLPAPEALLSARVRN